MHYCVVAVVSRFSKCHVALRQPLLLNGGMTAFLNWCMATDRDNVEILGSKPLLRGVIMADINFSIHNF